MTDDIRPPMIRSDERAFTRRHGDKKVTVCLNPVDSQRADHCHRHLGKPNKILDVVGERIRGRSPCFACQTIHGNPHLFEEALSFLKPGGSMVVAQRQPVGERFCGGQAWGQPLSQPIRV